MMHDVPIEMINCVKMRRKLSSIRHNLCIIYAPHLSTIVIDQKKQIVEIMSNYAKLVGITANSANCKIMKGGFS